MNLACDLSKKCQTSKEPEYPMGGRDKALVSSLPPQAPKGSQNDEKRRLPGKKERIFGASECNSKIDVKMKVAEQKEPMRRKMSWKDQLSPKVFRFMSSSSKTKIPEREDDGNFRIVHFPDRPQRVVAKEEIPSEDECRAMLLDVGRSSMESQSAPETISEYEYRDDDELPTPMSTTSTLQVPGNRSSGLSATGSFMTTRTYSPHPWVGEATTVTFAKINKVDKTDKTKHFTPEDYFPRQPPTYIAPPVPPIPPLPQMPAMPTLQIPKQQEEKKPAVQPWSWKKLAPKPLVLRRPSRPEDALHSHPVHVHRGSVDNLCRVCHIGLAEAWGVCQHCSDDCSSVDDLTASFPRPPTLQRPKAKLPHTLNSIALHRQKSSLLSNPESNFSEPLSPLSPISPTTVYTPMTLEIPEDRPLTPLSAMPTPHLLARLENKGKDARNVYEEEWADYYFDNGNFTARRRDSEVDDFMLRELSLEEYDGVFASPVNPGPGWI